MTDIRRGSSGSSTEETTSHRTYSGEYTNADLYNDARANGQLHNGNNGLTVVSSTFYSQKSDYVSYRHEEQEVFNATGEYLELYFAHEIDVVLTTPNGIAKGRTGSQSTMTADLTPGGHWIRPRPAAERGEAGDRGRGGFIVSDLYRVMLR